MELDSLNPDMPILLKEMGIAYNPEKLAEVRSGQPRGRASVAVGTASDPSLVIAGMPTGVTRPALSRTSRSWTSGGRRWLGALPR